MKKQLTPEEYSAASKACEEIEDRKMGLCERDWPCYRHKKSKKVVKAMGTDKSLYAPSIYVKAIVKDPNTRHIRTTPVCALNFQRDYELVTAQ